MQTWHRISVLLCTYGFFRELRPNEPFVSEFLSGEWRDLTAEEVTQHVYPVGTYSYLALLVVAFLVTDMLRYKPLIIVSACANIVLYVMLLWTRSLAALQAAQFFYGVFMATEVAYFTYIYAKVDRAHFPVVTGFTKSAMLVGRFLAAVISQLLISFELMNVRELNYISLGSQAISLAWAFLLPSVATSVYFYARDDSGARTTSIPNERTDALASTIVLAEKSNPLVFAQPIEMDKQRGRFSARRAVRLLWTHFRESYANVEVVQWSLWWALTMAGFMQVQTYVQFLWQAIDVTSEPLFNGAAEAALTLLGAVAAFGAGYLNVERFDRWSIWVLSLVSTAMGGILLWGTLTADVLSSYVAYVLFGMATHFMITLASINVAKRLSDDSFGLVFGINTLLALIIQTLLTVVVISESGFALDPRDQFKVNSGYFVVLGIVYGIVGVVRLIWRRNRL